MMREVEIVWDGKKGVVKLRPLKFGELLEVQKQSVKKRIVNGMVVQDTDDEKFAVLTLMKSIVEAPFEVNEENILKLDGKYAMLLLEVANELNSFQADRNEE